MVIHCCWVYPCAKKNLSKENLTTGDHVERKGYGDKSRWTFHVPNWQFVNLVKLPDTIQGSSKGRVRWVMLLAIFWGVKGVAGAKSWWYWLMLQKSCPTCWCNYLGQVILGRHFFYWVGSRRFLKHQQEVLEQHHCWWPFDICKNHPPSMMESCDKFYQAHGVVR